MIKLHLILCETNSLCCLTAAVVQVAATRRPPLTSLLSHLSHLSILPGPVWEAGAELECFPGDVRLVVRLRGESGPSCQSFYQAKFVPDIN